MLKMHSDDIVELQRKFPPRYKLANGYLTKLHSYDFSSLEHVYLTCRNHRWMRYVTKNPYTRACVFLQGPNGLHAGLEEECDCPFEDLRVI